MPNTRTHTRTRLKRSYDARLRNRDDIAEFCRQHAIPYSDKYYAMTQPTEETRRDFDEAYAMDPLPPSDLPAHGASAIIVFEQKEGKIHHGEMVTAAADRVANNLQPGIESIYVAAGLNTAYRHTFQPELEQSVSQLIANQGVPVMNTSVGWNDITLSFRRDLEQQFEELWKVTAFVVDSTGNSGQLDYAEEKAEPFQKHNAVSHAPPLVVHVGAAACDAEGKWQVEGYSSANSPTFLAPVWPDKKAVWEEGAAPNRLTGTTLAAPYVTGALSALNYRYGRYLTREQILYAVIATCKKVDTVGAFVAEEMNGSEPTGRYFPKTPFEKTLEYQPTRAGLTYNPEYAGFGMIQPHAADRLLAQMVALTQANPKSITVPVEERVRLTRKDLHPTRDSFGDYVYEIDMPPGIALKTTLMAEFEHAHGGIRITSPSGTSLPLVMSRDPANNSIFGISTSHGWAGEPLKGTWRIESTEPLKELQLNQHHFRSKDIVQSLDVPALLAAPVPDLSHARPLTEIIPDHDLWRKRRDVMPVPDTKLHAPIINEGQQGAALQRNPQRNGR